MRQSGILMHISSLPSPHGIGTLGKAAYEFTDFLKKAGQHFWQVLPVNPTSYGDSPYQSPSAFAGNPYFIDLDALKEEGLLSEHEINNYYFGKGAIDYYLLFQNRYPLLRTAFQRFEKNEKYEKFKNENAFWLEEFSVFMALKEQNHFRSWIYWDKPFRTHDEKAIQSVKERLANEIEFYKFLQYKFFEQWEKLKKYANENEIEIIGDMPIYVALDSAEVWSRPELFLLDEEHLPIKVAGCPPDAFSSEGQLWGNPLYRWDVMEKDGFAWWIERIKMSEKLFDRVRIDHFRGFEAYYTIDYGKENAIDGKWEKGPGMKLFNKVKEKLGDVNIIAEDLGFLTEEVHEMLRESGYPGMKVMQFAFDPYGDNVYLPHNHIKNCVVYTGTHDNDTTKGWYGSLGSEEREFVKNYLRISGNETDAITAAALGSVAETVIVPIQDYMCLGSEGRMNTPSTLGGNWLFRIAGNDLNNNLAEKIRYMTKLYRR